MQTQISHGGAGYFISGFSLIMTKGVKRYVFIPLMVNLVLFYLAFSYLFGELDSYIAMTMEYIPDFLSWLEVIIWPFAVISLLVIFSFIFTSVANWLAAPFNGLLSEKIEAKLTGKLLPDTGLKGLLKDIPRTLGREWQKLCYYIPRAIGFFIIFLLLPIFGQIIWFLFVAWMMAVQYKDYPFDNHKIPFDQMRNELKQRQGLSYSFGITVSIFAMIPIINLIVMPVAICGATALWVERYRPHLIQH